MIEALCGTSVDIVGHAYGNRVARAIAATRPDLVASVVLLAAGGREPLSEEMVRAIEVSVAQGLVPDPDRLQALQTAFFAAGNDPAVWLSGWTPEAATLQSAANRATPRDAWWSAGAADVLVIQASDGDRHAVRPATGRTALRLPE